MDERHNTRGALETVARRVLSDHYAVDLTAGSLPGIAKLLDFVSPDRRVVGDAKYFSLVGGVGLPPAKFSIIAEHVWLLEKTSAPSAFLVFGKDRAVPQRWLARYGVLASSVAFFLCVRRWNARAFGRTRAVSEYQYDEFAAIDRPLTSEQMSRLRALSTRATITPTRFCNFYTWGDFKGDPLALMEEYFDAFVYVTNWARMS